MTIALVIKVNDGLVLASDSATTLASWGPDGQVLVANIYNNANKIFNLRKGLPISAMTWGLGNIGPASISTLAKDLRRRFSGDSQAHHDWVLDPDTYTMDEVVGRFKEFFYDENYRPYIEDGGDKNAGLGLLVAGYGAGQNHPEMFCFGLGPDGCTGPVPLLADNTGASWWGEPEAISRLVNGVSNYVPQALINLKTSADEDAAVALMQELVNQCNVQLVAPAMPIQDAIDLAEFLVQVTIGFMRFLPGNPTVGGPIEIAAVTKHEGFKWVKRKHYFNDQLNPRLPGGHDD
ncbi:hypothetical protein H7J87_08385 [Mycolicibacterium wolinskyi]|uniref:Uncharacterized protein n=1 Tax=Mycolicibacterium wolinskyi TaxID=59750 RepID=A0A1X2FH04_9MYCO|nr:MULTISPECIES: hypothetical protein [Mycolicibacterium]MCV7285344.1 hypothetical protein [Mycolicibacterium wolinskyi]MCV7295153.1 hypothetical protein [Mycolicibacterium goodii]ORX17722.1 hypothetical protein AWC31_14860 [Mycolicibacterium wolinskyi]